jgi:transposase
MGLTDNFHSRYDLNMPVGVDFPSRLDHGFQSTSKSLECQRFKNLVSLTEKLVWLGRYRRLSKDYEYLTETSEVMIYLAMINLMVRRLAEVADG